MEREDLERTLAINGVSIADGDAVVAKVLEGARYKEAEIKEALNLLKNTPDLVNKSRVEGLHKLFRTDNSLRPDEISKLLNIEISEESIGEQRARERNLGATQLMMVGACSVVLALGGIVLYMYLNEMGVFHPSSVLSLRS